MNRISHQTESLKSIIENLCQSRRLQEALNLILTKPIHQDHSLYSKVLQLCIDIKADKQGLLIHRHLISNGFISNIHLDTKLIIFYSKINRMVNAQEVFDKMPERSVVSWTALISGYSQNGDSKEALSVFSVMKRVGVKANQFTYGSALRACTSLMCSVSGWQIHGCIQKGRFCEHLFVQSALVDFHSKCGKMDDACYLFEHMFERDVVSWNAMIGGYVVQGFSKEAFLLFRSMLREGVGPDSFTLGNVLKSSSRDMDFKKVNLVHVFIVQLGFESHTILIGSLIDAYVKCGNLQSANYIYSTLQRKDTISCTALITGYARAGGNLNNAINLFRELHEMKFGLDDVILCSMLNICANNASLEVGMQLHALSVKYQPNYDIAMGNALIDLYSKSGEVERAHRAFDEMEDKNVISWTSLIAGYGKNGYGDKAIELYKKMVLEGYKPNDITFLSLFFVCSHNGLTSEGSEFFENMVNEYNISPRPEHYSCMVDLLARNGQLEEACNLISKLNIKPSASLWGSIIGACRVYGNTCIGEIAAKQLFDLDPEKSVNFVSLSSIYASAGLWEDASKMRKLMEDKGLSKDPGFSQFIATNKISALDV